MTAVRYIDPLAIEIYVIAKIESSTFGRPHVRGGLKIPHPKASLFDGFHHFPVRRCNKQYSGLYPSDHIAFGYLYSYYLIYNFLVRSKSGPF